MSNIIINSWEDLQKAVIKITVSLNKEPNLKIAAAANPILALSELGYQINKDLLSYVEDKLRFHPNVITQLVELRESVYKVAGTKFNIRSEEELNRVFFDELKIEAFDEAGCPIKRHLNIRRKGDPDDDLVYYLGLHPVVEPLLKFREIDASVAGFCDFNTYQKIRHGQYGYQSNIQLKIRLKNKNTH